jgi:single-strand DNA-binding protein
MAGHNHVSLLGNASRDPEVRSGGEGDDTWKVARFGLAVESYSEDAPDFFDCEAWNRAPGYRADFIERNVQKGRRLLVEGRLQRQQWTEEDGGNRSRVVVVVEELWFLGPRKDGGGTASQT